MSHHTDRIQQELEEARARTRRDIDDLQTRAHERTFIDEGLDMIGGGQVGDYAERFGRKILSQARQHPLPSALIGAGLLMMATGGTSLARQQDDEYDPYADPDVDPYGGRAGLTDAAEHEELEALYGPEWSAAHRTMTLAEETERNNPRRENEDVVAYHTRLYDAYGRSLEIDRQDNEDDVGFRRRIDEALTASRGKVEELRQRLDEHRAKTGRRVKGAYGEADRRVRSAYGQADRGVRDAYGTASAKTASAARQTRDSVRGAAHKSKYAAKDAASTSRDAAKRSVNATEDFIVDNPFAAGGIAILAGLAAGSFFRMTEREERALSGVATAIDEQARKLDAAANERVREYAEEVERVADDVRDDIKTEERPTA